MKSNKGSAAENFYHSIAQTYDYIFPLKDPAFKFTKNLIKTNYSVIDAGCGTGNMSIALASFCNKIDGFDLDAEMIQIAQRKSLDIRNITFQTGDLMKIAANYPPESYNLIFCYGNTLVHLLSFDKISLYLKQVNQTLKQGGKIALQILNYNYILDNHITELPTIENEHIRFVRKYDFTNRNRVFQFNTHLTIKATEKIIENSAPLMAIRPEELIELLNEAGFIDIKTYSSFKKDPINNDSLPLIITGEKSNKLTAKTQK